MTLNFPTTVQDPRVQQCLDFIASRFPLDNASLARVFVRKVASLPASGLAGELVYNTGDNKFYGYNGTEWKAL